MLDFFRRYQKIFFIIISVVVIVSFSFFGTYNTIDTAPNKDSVAFKAIDGQEVSQHQLSDLVKFISSDSDDKRLGMLFNANFLNDGAIVKDLFKSGLAVIIAEPFLSEIEQDLTAKMERERKATLYTHPQASFISTENAWTYFAPNLKKSYEKWIKHQAFDAQALQERIDLYLEQRRFAPASLKQVLRYQESQYDWLAKDPSLEQADLALFGYHTLEDWFGQRFLELMAEMVINFAKIAEKRGYTVSLEEATADLWRNAEASYRQFESSPYFQVPSLEDYLRFELQALGYDINQAAQIWRQILLFRRLVQDVGATVFVDPLPYEQFYQSAKEALTLQKFSLPPSLKIQDFRSLQQFQAYLLATSDDVADSWLSLPTQFKEADVVAKSDPQLVAKSYAITLQEISKKELCQKVSTKETWDWQVKEENWPQIVADYPELGLKDSSSVEKRLALLESLDDAAKAKLDDKVRLKQVDAHPEWIREALQQAPIRELTLTFKLEDTKLPLNGISDVSQLQKLLDQAPLNALTENEEEGERTSENEAPNLKCYSQDDRHYYRIYLKQRDEEWQVLTFAEAMQEGSLDKTLENLLKRQYKKSGHQAKEVKEDSFEKVRHEIALALFSPLLKEIEDHFKQSPLAAKLPELTTEDQKARFRMYPYMRDLLQKLKADPSLQSLYTRADKENGKNEGIEKERRQNQWKLLSSEIKVERSRPTAGTAVFHLKDGEWSEIEPTSAGDFPFYLRLKKEVLPTHQLVERKIDEARRILAKEANILWVKDVMKQVLEQKALFLAPLENISALEAKEAN